MTLIERVARALCAEFGIPPDSIHWKTEGDDPAKFQSAKNWTRFSAEARTAIEAMREPTEVMLAAAKALDVIPDWNDCASAEQHYAAMIDAALSEKP
jgi:hypothetical protein